MTASAGLALNQRAGNLVHGAVVQTFNQVQHRTPATSVRLNPERVASRTARSCWKFIGGRRQALEGSGEAEGLILEVFGYLHNDAVPIS